jgi:hypothetical protein
MQIMGTLLTIIGSLNVFLLGLLLWQIKGLREELRAVCDELGEKTDKRTFERETANLWKRVHCHKHNNEGNVVIIGRE